MSTVHIGQLIRNGRKRKGLTQEELAASVDVSTMTIRRYESGERIIPNETLRKIRAVLGDSFFDSLAQYVDNSQLQIIKGSKWAEKSEENRIFNEITNNCQKLNTAGMKEASKRIEELTRLHEYQRTPTAERTETPSESFQDAEQGNKKSRQKGK